MIIIAYVGENGVFFVQNKMWDIKKEQTKIHCTIIIIVVQWTLNYFIHRMLSSLFI